jgi:excinuclease ABC subunit C
MLTLEKIKQLDIPRSPGCYQFIDKRGVIIYIGKAADLSKRVVSYWQKSTRHSPAKERMMEEIETVHWIATDSEIEAFLLEANLIKKHQPKYNILLRDDKRFTYIKVSVEDEIPGVFATRKIDKAGKYYGPFVSSLAVREVLKTIRKIWPYCTMGKIQQKPCFYYQISRCTGVCGGVIGRKEYLEKIVKPIILFFEGKKDRIIKKMEREMQKAEKRGDFESVERIKYSLKNFYYVIGNSHILSLADKYASDVVELAKLLSLPAVPSRIEGYDISNMFGKEAVGSMVVFADGEPNKSQYRKFKIKGTYGKDGDVQMLREVLERRLKKSGKLKVESEKKKKSPQPPSPRPLRAGQDKGGLDVDWPMPDLIIVDGGKQQLNVGLKALKKFKLSISIIAISKGEGLRSGRARDKLFFAGQSKPLELPLASPALHVIKRVRDEAHRFAIGYHRLLKKKKIRRIEEK